MNQFRYQIIITGLLTLTLLSCDRQNSAPPDTPDTPDTPPTPDTRLQTNQPIKIALPSFELTERSGQTVSSAALQGKVWVANFIFTRCAGPCPALTSQFYILQQELKKHPSRDNIRLVTFTVDPEYDTPEILAKRAKIALADPKMWLWLTGKRPQLWTLIEKGFLLPVGENKQDPKSPIMHTQKFVLIDQAGKIRGYYDGLESESRDRLKHDLDALLK